MVWHVMVHKEITVVIVQVKSSENNGQPSTFCVRISRCKLVYIHLSVVQFGCLNVAMLMLRISKSIAAPMSCGQQDVSIANCIFMRHNYQSEMMKMEGIW